MLLVVEEERDGGLQAPAEVGFGGGPTRQQPGAPYAAVNRLFGRRNTSITKDENEHVAENASPLSIGCLMWRLFLSVAVGLAVGCGQVDDASIRSETPAHLHPLVAEPSCFTAPPATHANPPDPDRDALVQRRAIAATEGTFLLQYAQLLLEPLVTDPNLLEWKVEDGEGGALDGRTVVRSEEWGQLVATATDLDDGFFFSADVSYDPSSTSLTLADTKLIVGIDFWQTPEYARGCDAGSGISFELFQDGVDGPRELTCWRSLGDRGPTADECWNAAFSILLRRLTFASPEATITVLP